MVVSITLFMGLKNMHGIDARLLYKCLILIGRIRACIMGGGSFGSTLGRVMMVCKKGWMYIMFLRMVLFFSGETTTC